MPEAGPLVAATVLNHRGVGDAEECVASILASDYPNFRVIIIDNGSVDGSGGRLHKLTRDTRVEMIRCEHNRGSVGGTNVGIRRALQTSAEYIFSLSNDIVIRPDVISRLVEIMEVERGAGVIQPCIMFHDRPEYIWSRGGYFSRWLARGSMPDINQRYRPGDERLINVDVIVGCAMFFRRQLLEEVGLLDERYFYQNEEYDFFSRIKSSGWLVKVAMGARITHKHGRTVGVDSYDRWYYATRNRLLFIREHLTWPHRATALTAFALSRLVKCVQWLSRGRPELIQATLEGWHDCAAHRVGRRGYRPNE